MKLSDYATQEGIGYRAAWNRFHAGKIPGAYTNDAGRIVVPSPQDTLKNTAVIYARVSTHGQKDDLNRQAERLYEFAVSRGYEVIDIVTEVASGVKDDRTKLTRLIHTNEHWGTLIVEHRDRLTRVGFGWFPTFLAALGKDLIVVDQSTDSNEGSYQDMFSLIYSLAASEYGKRGARNRAERAMREMSAHNE